MLKAVKECLRAWLLAHEKLYWFIVIGVAFTVFLLITMFGFAKLERAEAAEVPSYMLRYTDDIKVKRNEDIPYYAYITLMVRETASGQFNFVNQLFLIESYEPNIDIYLDGSGTLHLDTNYIYDENGVRDYDASNLPFYSEYTRVFYYFDGNMKLPENINFGTGFEINDVRPLPMEYSSSAPYLSFEKLEVDNRLNKSQNFLGTNAELYTVFFQTSSWKYTGELNSVSLDDESYTLNLKLEVEVPTEAYVSGLYDYFGYNQEKDRVVLKRNEELISYWNKDENADFRTVVIEYSIDVFPDVDGNVEYNFNFTQWEYLLRAFCPELNSECESMDARWKAVVLSYMHVRKITTEVVTTRSNSVVYGGYTTNIFERGVYDSCVDVYTSVDKNFVSSDLLEDMISDDLQKEEQEYKKALEEKIKELENQIKDSQTVVGGFGGNLEGSDLWTGFGTLSKGLAGLAPSIAALSALTGTVFAFIPGPIATIMSFTLLAICIIAIIKAIRG